MILDPQMNKLIFVTSYWLQVIKLSFQTNIQNNAKSNGGVCSLDKQRSVLRSDVRPINGTIASYGVASFRRNDVFNVDSVETMICINGFWHTIIRDRKGTNIA